MRCIRLATTTDVHMGYTAAFFPYKHFLPYYNGVCHHDFHHHFFTANYAPCFEWMDRWMGTDKPYEDWKIKGAMENAEALLEKAEKRKYGELIAPTYWFLNYQADCKSNYQSARGLIFEFKNRRTHFSSFKKLGLPKVWIPSRMFNPPSHKKIFSWNLIYIK